MADLTKVARILTNIEEVDGVVVAGLVDEGVVDVGIFPCLGDLWDVSRELVRFCRGIVASNRTEP